MRRQDVDREALRMKEEGESTERGGSTQNKNDREMETEKTSLITNWLLLRN